MREPPEALDPPDGRRPPSPRCRASARSARSAGWVGALEYSRELLVGEDGALQELSDPPLLELVPPLLVLPPPEDPPELDPPPPDDRSTALPVGCDDDPASRCAQAGTEYAANAVTNAPISNLLRVIRHAPRCREKATGLPAAARR
ncbi:MAG TPA: hypothetical protein VFP80_10800, partial [Thermoanaerobaculia bacterium]|nr:hypothetical protein [Thermoanaerobaculia bacterium]